MSQNPPPQILLEASATEFCAPLTVNVDLAGVANLYGYQLKVLYDSTKVSATGAFVNSFFDVDGDAAIPGGTTPPNDPWNAKCAGGTCRFAKTELDPDPAVSGSGTVATLTLTPVSSGPFTLSFDANPDPPAEEGHVLTDINGTRLTHSVGTLDLTVKCTAQASGVVKLQGRATPIDAGTVTLTDLGGPAFPPVTVNFDATTGAWAAGPFEVQPGPGGSNYQFDAAHDLYLGNQKTAVLLPGASHNAGTTTLRGGDATNSGKVDIGDLSCIGASFGSAPPGTCAGPGVPSADINKDGRVNIQDLSIAGGNYGKSTPQPW